jgi:hypothetical protein
MEELYKMDWLILTLAICFNGLEATLEAVFLKFNPAIHKFIERFHTLVVLFVFLVWAGAVHFIPNETLYWKLFLGYWFIRFLIYDTVWNATSIVCGADISIWYYGDVKLYDRIMKKLVSWGWFMKVVLGVVGIVFLLGIK